MKYKYQCLENDLERNFSLIYYFIFILSVNFEANSIKWLAKKEFLVSYNDAENNPRIFYHEILKNQVNHFSYHLKKFFFLIYGLFKYFF